MSRSAKPLADCAICERLFYVYLRSIRIFTSPHFLGGPANTPDSPESPRFLLRESPPDQPVAVEEAPVFEGAAG